MLAGHRDDGLSASRRKNEDSPASGKLPGRERRFAFIAECLMPFFKVGAFARNGLLNFWLEFPIWFVWAPTLTYFILKAITRLEEEAESNAARA